MAESKKKAVGAKTVKTEAAVAPAEVKADAVETKGEAKTTVKKETKTAAKKAPVKKTAAKKTEAKKTESAEPKAKKPAAVQPAVHFQFSGKSYSTEDLQKIAADVWKYDLHKDEEAYTSLELYVKPEESIVYYVFNGDITGSFFI